MNPAQFQAGQHNLLDPAEHPSERTMHPTQQPDSSRTGSPAQIKLPGNPEPQESPENLRNLKPLVSSKNKEHPASRASGPCST